MIKGNAAIEEQTLFNEDYYNKQFALLRHMHEAAILEGVTPLDAKYPVKSLAADTTIGSADEILRILYILEGQNLVAPAPPGDFTSTDWALTVNGADVAKQLAAKKKNVSFSDLY